MSKITFFILPMCYGKAAGNITAAVTIRLKGMLCKFQSFMAFYITELGILYVKLTQGAPACGFILDNNMSEEAFFLAIWQSSCMLFST